MPAPHKRSLPRLGKEAYRGNASVFWTHSLQDRKTGWLTDALHFQFRELLCHILSKHEALCPIYCLMPDHFHLLTTGIKASCDQLQLTRAFRKEMNRLIAPFHLQAQAHDHVLRSEETEKEAFQSVAFYIQQNPIRKELCTDWKDYSYTGCLIPGYFNLNPRQDNYWELFWRIHNKLVSME